MKLIGLRKKILQCVLLISLISMGISVVAVRLTFAENYSLEQTVAIVDAGHYVPESDQKVKRIRYLLGSLHVTTGYSQEKIADQAAATKNIIRDNYGKKVTILELLEAANKAETIKKKTVKLEEYFAVYAALAGKK